MRIINPYEGVDFMSTSRVLGNTHEHIYNITQVKRAWDRGVRVFGCVNYFPSAPSVSPKHFNDDGTPSRLSRWKVPFKIWDLTFDEDNQPIIPAEYPNISPEETPTKTLYYEGSIVSFVDKDGNTIYTDDIPQIANQERTNKWIDRKFNAHTDPKCNHFNLLGYLGGEATNYTYYAEQGYFDGDSTKERSFNGGHPFTSFQEDCEYALLQENQQFDGLIFGTANHPYYGNSDINQLRWMLDNSNGVIKAVEYYNDGDYTDTEVVLRWCDKLYAEGYRFWGVAVVDWQSDNQTGGEAAFNRGYNSLLIDGYDSIETADLKAKAALETYIAGRYYCSGTGLHYITSLKVDGKKVKLILDSTASKIVVVSKTSRKEVKLTDTIEYEIRKGDNYVRFEAYFYQSADDMDFIFTNPIWIEDNSVGDDRMKKNLLLLYS